MPARPAISSISPSSFIAAIRPAPSSEATLPAYWAANAFSALLGLAQQGVDGGLGIVPSAVQQMGEIPLDRLQVGIGDGGFHGRTD